MHSNVTIKNVSWPHFSWPTLYTVKGEKGDAIFTREDIDTNYIGLLACRPIVATVL